jgi:hypothetical protein
MKEPFYPQKERNFDKNKNLEGEWEGARNKRTVIGMEKNIGHEMAYVFSLLRYPERPALYHKRNQH